MKPRARLAAVKPPSATLYEPRPAWAHPHSAAHRDAYLAAIAFLRRDKQSRWLLDRASIAPPWRALPVETTA
ncbi:MAG: hypothetical protein IT381_32845 [Deltaproteobacteria bacterium]|nr:hypothetical protein [Deltaproteobacteria bacterium]